MFALQLFKLAIEENDHTRRQRAVVLLASIAAQLNIYGFVGYGAAKFALRGAWEALTMEGDPLGIRVLCAFPPSTGALNFMIIFFPSLQVLKH